MRGHRVVLRRQQVVQERRGNDRPQAEPLPQDLLDGHHADIDHGIQATPRLFWRNFFLYSFFFLFQGLLVFAIVKYTPLTYNATYVYPLYGQLIGGALALSSVIFVPLGFFYTLIKSPGVKIQEVRRSSAYVYTG